MASWTCASCGGENPGGTKFCGHCGLPAVERPADIEAGGRDIADALRSFVAGPVAERLVEAGGHIPEERRLVTALFADVSGFTTLADRLDPEQLLEVIDPVIATLSSVVGRHEGYVEKFAGDALMALFGAPVSHEDDAKRAVRVAIEMHAELARIVEELPYEAELTLHVGINSGHGIARILGSEARMDYGVLGDAVILAQRLESAAPAGETYVSETTVRLTEREFEFESVGGLTLKGKAEPVPAFRLVGMQSVRATSVAAALVGRQREVAAVMDALGGLEKGRRGTVVAVTGEPGIGKSRLTVAVENDGIQRGFRWLHGRCLSYGAGLAYWPYADLLRRWAGVHGTTDSQEAGARLAAALERSEASAALPFFAQLLGLASVEAEAPAELEPEAFRRARHLAFAEWLRALAAERPVVLVLEDVQWIDASSLELTQDLAFLVEEAPVALYLVGRPETGEWLDSVVRDGLRLPLDPLDEAGIETLIRTSLGSAPPTGLASFVATRTAGNPLFIQELLRSLLDGGAIERENGGWRMRPGWDARTLPATLEEVLSARIDMLTRPAALLLQKAAVIGRRVPFLLLDAVADEPAEIETLADDLVARGFLDRQNGTLVFHHELIQDAAYERLLRRRRQELHRRVADAAEALYGAGDDTIDLLARHLYLGGGSKAVDYLRRAGERAKRLYANEEAILHFGRALEHSPEDTQLRLDLADLHELVGDYEDALQLYGEVRDASPGDVHAWRGLAATMRQQGRYVEALAVVDEAFRTDGLRGADLAPLWLEQGWTLSVAGRLEQAVDVLAAAIAAVGGRGDAVVGRLLLQLARTETLRGHSAAALVHELEAKRIFEETEDVRDLATTMRLLGDTHRTRGEFDDAAASLRTGLELAQRTGSIEEIAICLGNLAMVELDRGRFAEAVACNLRAIEEFERIGHGAGRAQGYANLAFALLHTGEDSDALDYAERAIEAANEIGHRLAVADAVDTIARVALRGGRLQEAATRAEEASERYLEAGAGPQAAVSLELAAEAWEQVGDDERARASRERARSFTPA